MAKGKYPTPSNSWNPWLREEHSDRNHWPSESRGLSLGQTTLTYKKCIVKETVMKNISTPVNESFSRTITGNSISVGKVIWKSPTWIDMAKTNIRIGFWNVRTMYASGKLAEITAEMKRYNLHVIGDSESRWMDSGRIWTTTDETLLYSGQEDGQHHEGVAVILKKGVEKSLMAWKPISNRLLTIGLRGKQVNTIPMLRSH